jgi:hypothetical protein
MSPLISAQLETTEAQTRPPFGLRALFLSLAIVVVVAAQTPLAALALRVIG